MSEEEKLQKELLKELENNDVKVAEKEAKKMKENILNGDSGNWLGLGVHEVSIDKVKLFRANTGTLGMEFTVSNADGKATVPMWLSEKSLPLVIERCSRLMVLNAPEEKKNDTRTFMSNILSAKELFDTIVKTLTHCKKVNKEFKCWLLAKESETQTYTNDKGEEKPQIDRYLLSYQPKEKAKTAVEKMIDDSEDVDLSEVPFLD